MRPRSVWIAATRSSPDSLFRCGAALSILIFLILIGVSAQSAPTTVKEIRVEGTNRLSAETVLYYIKIKPGDTLSPAILSHQIRELYALGFFDDIKVYSEASEDGLILTFVVVERPLVDAIRVEGAEKVKMEKIREKITVELKKPLERHKLAESVAAIRDLYVERGYNYAKVTPELHTVSPGEVVVVFTIEERAKVKVSDIRFMGNNTFSAFTLKGQVQTRERFGKHPFSGCRFFFTRLGKYAPEVVERDRLLLERFYMTHGYLEVDVSEAAVEYDDEREGLVITFTISEGSPYKIGSVSIEGNTIFPQEELEAGLSRVILPGRMRFGWVKANEGKLVKGEGYSLEVEEAAIGAIRDRYGSRGYIYADIQAVHDLHFDTKVVDILLSIEEDSQYRLNRLTITGNTRTRDKVLRREIKITEGEILDMTELKRGIDRIRYLGFIEPDIKPEIDADRKEKTADVNIKIKEGRLHEIRFTATYSKYQKFGIGGSIVEHNFMGYGQTFGITAHFSEKTRTYDIDFDEPNLLDTDYSFGVGVYDHRTEYMWYTRESAGGRLTFGKRLTDHIRASATYRLENVRMTDVGSEEYRPNDRDIHWDPDIDTDERLSPLRSDFDYQDERSLTSSETLAIWWDSRDNWIKPTRGIYALASGTLAGSAFGGDNDFYKAKAEARWHYPLLDRLIFTTKGELEYGGGYFGDDLPLFERYYLGGAMLGGRGFDTYELGPKDKNGNSVGGNKSLLFTAELFYVLADPLHVGVFWDAGQVFPKDERYDLDRLRTSYGLEVRIFVPMFVYPIRLVYGIKNKPLEGEDKSSFDFAIGVGN